MKKNRKKIIELHAERFTMPFKRIFNSWGGGGGMEKGKGMPKGTR
jgi:hypothetical protein